MKLQNIIVLNWVICEFQNPQEFRFYRIWTLLKLCLYIYSSRFYFRSPLFRFPHDQLTDEQTNWLNPNSIVEILSENFEKICSRLNIKTLDEYYNTSPSYSQLFTQQQRQFAHSTENLDVTPKNEDRAFTDLNLRISKRSFHTVIPTFKIDYTLVNRVELNWPILFMHIIVRLKSSIIYHFITLRFEFQENASSSLTDPERLAVGKLIELLPPFFNEKK